jgi:hypothetical protein
LGSSFYLIYQTPKNLLEAAFEMALAGGLIPKTKKTLNSESWLYKVAKKTIKYKCPDANSFHEFIEYCSN